MKSEEFADSAAKYLKSQAEMGAEIRKGSSAWLQMWNVASTGEVEELRRELRTVTARLAALKARLGAS